MDNRQIQIGNKDSRHFHLSELPPSQYAQLQMSGSDYSGRESKECSIVYLFVFMVIQ